MKSATARLGLFRRWLERLEGEGKTQYVQELEMWLKSFERYFRPTNLPFSEEDRRQSTLRDYSEELEIVHDVIFRISQVCTLLLSEEETSYSSFAKYIENSLKQSYFTDTYIRTLMRHQRPKKNLTLLMEGLLDVRTLIVELTALNKVSFLCFTSIGRMINRELRKGVYIDFFLEKKQASLFDRVSNPEIVRIVRSIQIPQYKRAIASIFLELFRNLRYLHAIGLQMQDAVALKRSLLIFSLVHAELSMLAQFMKDEFLRKEHPDAHFVGLIEGLAYSLSMELKKVMQRELLDAASLQQYELIFTKIQNSQGILLNSVQQIVYSLAQYFDPRLQGEQIFPDYVTKLEQSLRLRSDVTDLRDTISHFIQEGGIER
ncbi:MAG TPA: hypothetical protein VJ521_09130, partial [Acidobacteriota bacterium]|nr:hypothetical protein [Acidobacteriota bacterium]